MSGTRSRSPLVPGQIAVAAPAPFAVSGLLALTQEQKALTNPVLTPALGRKTTAVTGSGPGTQ